MTLQKECSDNPISYRQAFLIFLERERQLIDKWNNADKLYPYQMFGEFYDLLKEIEKISIEDNHQ